MVNHTRKIIIDGAKGFIKSEMIRNASVLVTGTVIAQVITIILQPVLRRLYPAEVFGVFSVYMSLIGILSVAGSLRYEDTIVLPRKDKEATNIVFLSLFFNTIFSLLLFILILVFGKPLFSFLNIPESFPSGVLYLVPLSVFLYNSFQYLNNWLIRKKRFSSVSLNKISRRGTEGVTQVIFALSRNPRGLIISDIIGQSANIAMAAYQSFRSGFSFKHVGLTKLRYVFTKYSDFPKYNLITTIAGTCSFMLPPIFVNKFYSSETAGYFDLARVILSIPVVFLTTAFSNVLFQKVSERFNLKESFAGDLKRILLILVPLAIAEILIIRLFGEEIFLIIGGKENVFSGTIAGILVWSMALNFLISTFTSVFISVRKIGLYSLYQLFYFSVILLLLFFRKMEILDFLRVYVFLEVFCYVVLSVILISIIVKHEKSVKSY